MDILLIAGVLLCMFSLKTIYKGVINFALLKIFFGLLGLFVGYILITDGEQQSLMASMTSFVDAIMSLAYWVLDLFGINY